MNKQHPRSKDIVQLLRLHRVRVSVAKSNYQTQKAEYIAAVEAVNERRVRIDCLRGQSATLSGYLIDNRSGELARFVRWSNARRDWLDDALERDEYWLLDDEQILQEAETRLSEAKQNWLRACARETGLLQLLQEAQSSVMRQREMLDELEAAEQSATSRVVV